MKVGVDGVLIGCWTNVDGVKNVLDVGTGCGLIALIMAQRCPDAKVTGIDVDKASVEESSENVAMSSWGDRIQILQGSFPEDLDSQYNGCFDLIISNPPYFDSGLSKIVTSRERARHQGSLSPSSLLSSAKRFLKQEGMLSMVVPSDLTSTLDVEARELGFSLMRTCLVRGHEGAPYKRTLLQWKLSTSSSSQESCTTLRLTLEEGRGIPTEEYRQLCKDFYLRF